LTNQIISYIVFFPSWYKMCNTDGVYASDKRHGADRVSASDKRYGADGVGASRDQTRKSTIVTSKQANRTLRASDKTIVSIPDTDVTRRSSLNSRQRLRFRSYTMTSSETTDNVKCVFSTFLFLSVIVGIFVVAIWINPGM